MNFLSYYFSVIIMANSILLPVAIAEEKPQESKKMVSIKQLDYGVFGEFIWTDKQPFTPRGSLVPDNIMRILEKAEQFQKLDKRIVEARLLYAYSADSEKDGTRRRIPLGLDVETDQGVEIRIMYKFDRNELDFVEEALKSIVSSIGKK
jgi:hypothetical protein